MSSLFLEDTALFALGGWREVCSDQTARLLSLLKKFPSSLLLHPEHMQADTRTSVYIRVYVFTHLSLSLPPH